VKEAGEVSHVAKWVQEVLQVGYKKKDWGKKTQVGIAPGSAGGRRKQTGRRRREGTSAKWGVEEGGEVRGSVENR